MSSAHVGDETSEAPIFTPSPQSSSWSKRLLLNLLYIRVDNFAPCWIPCCKIISSLRSPFHFIEVLASVCSDFTRSQRSPPTPSLNNFRRRLSCQTMSNAFSASSVSIKSSVWLSFASKKASDIISPAYRGDTPSVKPLCSLFCHWSRMFSNLVFKHDSNTLPIIDVTVIPL